MTDDAAVYLRQRLGSDPALPGSDLVAASSFAAQAPGAIVLGGDCGALGVARALARNGIAVRFLAGPNPVASYSRYTSTISGWPGAEAETALAWLVAQAEDNDARGWVLIPAGDSEVRLVTDNFDRLKGLYRLSSPPWAVTRWAGDKTLTYGRAGDLGIDHPRTFRISSLSDAKSADLTFPLILKPAMKQGVNALTSAKAWRADDRAELLGMFEEARELAGTGGLIVQELIPDDGTNQFSYAAFYENGQPRLVMTARRTRQRPRKMGTGTFVETLGPCAFESDAEKFLQSLNYNGLVEIEFMLDPRDGRFKLIDVNPRVWTWNALGLPAGVNFAMAAWQQANGVPVTEGRAAPGHSWLYVSRDMPGALRDIRDGVLPVTVYLRQLFGASAYAALSISDPLPAIVDVPLGLFRALKQLPRRHRTATIAH